MRLIKSIILSMMIVTGTGQALAQEFFQGEKPERPCAGCPKFSDMRAYRVSKMTDEEIRKAYNDAQEESEKLKREAKERAEQRKRDYVETRMLCADKVFETRNLQKCSIPITIIGGVIFKPEITPPVEYLFDGRIMGMCNHVGSMAKAYEYDCVPK
jgi:hypothetical protein